MSEITAITRYRWNGVEYSCLKDVQGHVESEIGKIIDTIPTCLGPKDRLAVLEMITKNHVALRKLLSVEFCTSDDIQPEYHNILDMDL